MPEQPTTSPGWYVHPDMADSLRYWDGEKWTDQVAPATPKKEKGGVSTTAKGVTIGVLVAAAVTYFAVSIANENSEQECSARNTERAIAGLPADDC